MLQHRHGAAYTKKHFELDGLDELPGDVNYGSGDDEYGVYINEYSGYGLYITEYPADLNSANSCAANVVGDVYNPEGVDMSLVDYPAHCHSDHSQCAIGDLATRHSPLNSNDSGVFVELRDCNLDIYGPNSAIRHAMILNHVDTDKTLSCCNIQMPTSTRVLRAQFDNAFRGEIKIAHPQYDNIDHIRNENTIITVNLELIKGRLTTNRLYWQLQYGIADDTCSHLYPILDQ